MKWYKTAHCLIGHTTAGCTLNSCPIQTRSDLCPTNELVEPPLLALAGHIEHHIAGEDRVGDVEDLALKATNGGAIPADIHHYSFHCLQQQQSTQTSVTASDADVSEFVSRQTEARPP